MTTWHDISSAPRDGRSILCIDSRGNIHVCYPKLFPRPVNVLGNSNVSMVGDVWEYFRDDINAPGHTWSMVPTHWMPLPEPPEPRSGAET